MNQSDKVFAALMYAAEEYRTVSADDVLAAAEEIETIDDPPGRRTIVDHCNNLAEIGLVRTVESGRWKFIGTFDPST